MREIVDCMYPKNYNKNDMIVKEGDIGQALYVIAGKKFRSDNRSFLGAKEFCFNMFAYLQKKCLNNEISGLTRKRRNGFRFLSVAFT